jgi:hypothetical protein
MPFYRNLVRKYYPDYQPKYHHRVLINTSHPIGTPEFRKYMVAMGYLPKKIKARPQTAKQESVAKPTHIDLNPISQRNLSKLNFGSLYAPEKPRINPKVAAAKV